MISCRNCGEILKEHVQIYNHALQKQNISISPVVPVCKICSDEVFTFHICNGGKIIVINGTCGSGKTTIAEILQYKGYLAIDGDCAIQAVRHKKGIKQYEWNELINEIACEIDILSLFGENIVLSHVVLPEDLEKYIDIFEHRNMEYKFVLLKPAYQTAVERCQTRTCHDSVTPEVWIKHFYDILIFDDKIDIIDNTTLTAQETADAILKVPYRRTAENYE
jgi:gluconate kinase